MHSCAVIPIKPKIKHWVQCKKLTRLLQFCNYFCNFVTSWIKTTYVSLDHCFSTSAALKQRAPGPNAARTKHNVDILFTSDES